MTTSEQFFFSQAGYSYDAKVETPEQGKLRCAIQLAQAEVWAAAHGVTFKWMPDEDADPTDWDGEGPIGESAEGCVAKCASGGVLESLWGIWDASEEYRRVVQAELALEAMGRTSVCSCKL